MLLIVCRHVESVELSANISAFFNAFTLENSDDSESE